MVLQNKYKEIARTSLTAKAIFYLLSTRERNRRNMNLARLRTDVRHILTVPLRDTEFMATMRELEHAGAGKVNYGVRGAAKYFVWSVPITEVARMAGVTEEEFKQAQASLGGKPKGPLNLPRIVNGVRQEATNRAESKGQDNVIRIKGSESIEANPMTSVVFILPDGSIKKMTLSSEIPESLLTELAKLFIGIGDKHLHNRRKDDVKDVPAAAPAQSNVPDMQDH